MMVAGAALITRDLALMIAGQLMTGLPAVIPVAPAPLLMIEVLLATTILLHLRVTLAAALMTLALTLPLQRAFILRPTLLRHALLLLEV
jgi:hypothetical protein